jgi:hypothetical protein
MKAEIEADEEDIEFYEGLRESLEEIGRMSVPDRNAMIAKITHLETFHAEDLSQRGLYYEALLLKACLMDKSYRAYMIEQIKSGEIYSQI